jgi:hypothetical protein
MKKLLFIIVTLIFLGFYLQSEKPKIKTLVKSQETKIKKPQSQNLSVKKIPTPSLKKSAPTNIKNKVVDLNKPKSLRGDDFVAFDDKGHRYISQINIIGNHLVYHGDLLLGSIDDLDKIQKQKFVTQAKPQKWPKGEIPFVVDEALPNVNEVAEAIEFIQQNSKIKFIPRSNQKNFVQFTFGESDCYSYAGMKSGKQEIFLTPRCQTKEILHEIMHTLGFLHEQNREDRDQFVKIFWANIDEINKEQFKKIPNDFLGIKNRPFDYNSIMMYSSFTFSMIEGEPSLLTIDGKLIEPSSDWLSQEDLLRLNLAYP